MPVLPPPAAGRAIETIGRNGRNRAHRRAGRCSTAIRSSSASSEPRAVFVGLRSGAAEPCRE